MQVYGNNSDSIIDDFETYGERFIHPLLDIPDLYAGVAADDPLWTPPAVAYLDPSLGLVLPGVAGNYASVPDAPALDITGDITLVARVALDDWTGATGQALLGKWDAGANNSYRLVLNTNGTVYIQTTSTGTGAGVTGTSTAAVPFSDGGEGWIAATLDVDDGAGNRVYTFWTSTDGVTWTQLGSTVTAAGTTSIANTSSSFYMGGHINTAGMPVGAMRVASVYSGSGFSAAGPSGSLVLDVDFRRARAESFTATTGQTVTINSGSALAAWPIRGTLAGNDLVQGTPSKQPIFRGANSILGNVPVVNFDGTNDVIELLTGVSISQSYSIFVVGSSDVVGSARVAVGTVDVATSRFVGINATPNWMLNAGVSLTGGTPAANTPYAGLWYSNGTSSIIDVNGVNVASGDAGTQSMNQFVVGAGRNAIGPTYQFFWDGPIYMALIVPGDLRAKSYWDRLKRFINRKTGIAIV